MEYTIRRAPSTPALDAAWDDAPWDRAAVAGIDQFHPTERASDHRPRTRAKVLHDDAGIYVFFQVEDRYVRSTVTERDGSVCRDSCVEFFVEPVRDKGYFNFEINAGGTLHVSHIEPQHYKAGGGFTDRAFLSEDVAATVKIFHSLPSVVEPEIAEPTTWRLSYFVPYSFFETRVTPVEHGPGAEWRGNFYKCADATSHPHWAMWHRLAHLNFHQPEHFQPIRFED